MFREYSLEQRNAIYATIVHCLPKRYVTCGPTGADLWSTDMIETFRARLLPSIDDSIIAESNCNYDLCQKLKNEQNEYRLSVFTKVHLVLVHHGHFNAKGTVFLRKLKAVLGISHEHGLVVHGLISKRISSVEKTLSHTRDVVVDEYRYVKVGVIALSAGVALAVTGGLVSLSFHTCITPHRQRVFCSHFASFTTHSVHQ